MRILIMGGTRFIGVSLTQTLIAQGHEVVLFNRGNRPAPVAGVQQIHGDRQDHDQLRSLLAGQSFDAVFDNNGREWADTEPLANLFRDKVQHFVYVSSAGVYLKTDQPPHREGDAVDPKSRHKGKYETEQGLAALGLPWTAIRPVYIYGPQNYNDLEAWFFDRLHHDRPIPIPGDGCHLTQFGHVVDLAQAMAAVLGNTSAIGQIYNVSGDRAVSFTGLAKACAQAMGKEPETLKFVYYNPKTFDFGKRKAFPLRVQHFFTDIHKAQTELSWQPQFDLVSGLRDAYEKDYQPSGRGDRTPDFSLDDLILGG